jgi:hypothetical protein
LSGRASRRAKSASANVFQHLSPEKLVENGRLACAVATVGCDAPRQVGAVWWMTACHPVASSAAMPPVLYQSVYLRSRPRWFVVHAEKAAEVLGGDRREVSRRPTHRRPARASGLCGWVDPRPCLFNCECSVLLHHRPELADRRWDSPYCGGQYQYQCQCKALAGERGGLCVLCVGYHVRSCMFRVQGCQWKT